jgi:hypothetical protein
MAAIKREKWEVSLFFLSPQGERGFKEELLASAMRFLHSPRAPRSGIFRVFPAEAAGDDGIIHGQQK